MSNHYDAGNEYCPKCGESWYGDCPNKPYWIEYHCQNPDCQYAKGECLYSGEGMVIEESHLDIGDLITKVRLAYDE